ncbi:hypothetical protein AAFF_G00009380 [Aldrovandia affinis]|uniref:Uncharacterized protein n=1 Tax=Aldrovandia affinis TaxID=143900 RepID=A0AAD7T6H3_9TELE|nr:hypothetical protein AAFF_G00009380 [Aldrovandia affinis]
MIILAQAAETAELGKITEEDRGRYGSSSPHGIGRRRKVSFHHRGMKMGKVNDNDPIEGACGPEGMPRLWDRMAFNPARVILFTSMSRDGPFETGGLVNRVKGVFPNKINHITMQENFDTVLSVGI